MKLIECSSETQEWVQRECIAPIVSSAKEKIAIEDIIADCKVVSPSSQPIDLAAVTYFMLSCWAEFPKEHFGSIVVRTKNVLCLCNNPVWFNDCAIAIRDKCQDEISAFKYVQTKADDSVDRMAFREHVMKMIDYVPCIVVSEKCREMIVDSAYAKVLAQGVPGARNGHEPMESAKRKFKPMVAAAVRYFAFGKNDEQLLCNRLNEWREKVPLFISDIVERVHSLCGNEIAVYKVALCTRADQFKMSLEERRETVDKLETQIKTILNGNM